MRILPLLLVLALASPLHASAAGKGQPAPTPGMTPGGVINRPLNSQTKAIFQRVLQARLYHAGVWTLAGSSQTPATVARTILSLRPSFVTGILRLPDRGDLSNAEIEGFDTVRTAFHAAEKPCRFDVVINVGQERGADSFVRRMKEFNTRLHPDAWTFQVDPEAESLAPEVFDEGIAQAHANGQMVGYDGPLSMVPDGVDYIVVRASDLKVNVPQIEHLRAKHRVPLIVELPGTDAGQAPPEVITYVDKMGTAGRSELLTELARQQSAQGYHLAYPVFYPIHPSRHAFDSTKDNILLVTIRALMARFN
jgi:hypothetical protein